ncbi:hypothetical protein IDM40_04435 [Nocardiopsis sp. HNM0947]|uniref:WD40-like Beta Propeller Repeat n=1 Tax=Nocardiopsis coralli TaxID=2772213 RepID=A0ABR9P2A7_9ACTN|nr:hypothetical protein [Nocardiopsis coralli]MBE2997959.1 hypothetical protein [Nocardiopsis coralli]
MYETERHLVAPLTLVGLLVLTACGSDDTPPTEAPGSEASPEETVEIPPEDLSGLLIFNWSNEDTFVTFHDVEDGSLNSRLSLHELNEADEERHQTDWSQFVFSPDFRNALIETDQGLILGTLDDETRSYTPGATIAPAEEASFSGGEITYAAPQFSPDGTQIWFEERSEHGEDDSRILAVDVDDPESEPDHVGDVPRVTQAPDTVEEVQVHGQGLQVGLPETVYTISEDLDVEVLDLVESEPPGQDSAPEDALEFLMNEDGTDIVPSNFVRGPEETFIGPLESAPQEDSHTQLSQFSLDEEGAVTDEEVLLETEGNPINRYWYDSQGDRLLLQTSDAYYLHTIGEDGEPERAFEALDFGDDTDVAGESDSLGVFQPHED